ncbi:hypothetical protein B0H17DRAFT_1124501 [Mycena rosella]|uniref:Uncharacterized protein n=1 Tax=Mycena rosella TaxID=1033263 RepID=A0AAD7GZS0_MYCRO|nr:hypothetical protein B0H17DRAFT_1124501 [Mycena rosella]
MFHDYASMPEGLGDGSHGDADLQVAAGLHFRHAVIHHLHSYQNLSFVTLPYDDSTYEPSRASSVFAGPDSHLEDSTYNILESSPTSSRAHLGLETAHIELVGTAHTDCQPIEYHARDPDAYDLLSPIFSNNLAEEEQCRLNAWTLYRARHCRALEESNRRLPQSPPVPEVILIKKDCEDVHIFVMGSSPRTPLGAGIIIECIGELVGYWKTTSQLITRQEQTCNLWICEATEQRAFVRVEGYIILPPTLYKRIKVGLGKVKKRLFAPRPKNKSVQTMKEDI